MTAKQNRNYIKYSSLPFLLMVIGIAGVEYTRIYFFIYIINVSAVLFFIMFGLLGIFPRFISFLYRSGGDSFGSYFIIDKETTDGIFRFLIIDNDNKLNREAQ